MKNYSKYLKKKSLTIFLFHGVINKNPFKVRNYTKKHLLKNEFKKVLNDLKKKGNCISLDEVYSKICNSTEFDDYSYSITFDDGFFNNYKYAIPILKKRKLYATFYITTSFIDKNEMSWIDKIEHMIEKTKEGKNIIIFNKKLNFKNNVKSKVKFLNKVRYLAKRNKKVDFDFLVKSLKKQLGYKKQVNNLNNILDKKMNWRHISKINAEKYFSIGGHTVNHPILSFLKFKDVKNEIVKSIKIIKRKTNINIHHYSYPEGLFHTYGSREIKLLKKAGIKICPSAEFGLNKAKTNPFNLKRIFVNK